MREKINMKGDSDVKSEGTILHQWKYVDPEMPPGKDATLNGFQLMDEGGASERKLSADEKRALTRRFGGSVLKRVSAMR